MPNLKKISEGAKIEILALRRANLSIRDISVKVGFGKSSISDFLRKFEIIGSIKRKLGSGPARKITSAYKCGRNAFNGPNVIKIGLKLIGER
jgi:transposase